MDSYDWITKYCTDEYEGYVDNKTTLALTDDVARVKLGGSWRMPTKSEVEELFNKCTWEWTSYNGVNGQLITGPNGNNIFLPAAGFRRDTDFYDRGTDCTYWSATLKDYDAHDAYSLDAYEYGEDFFGGSRSDGLTVRPVKK